MNKREAELQRCLEKTLKGIIELQDIGRIHPAQHGESFRKMKNLERRITRTLKGGK